jgi:hypothetical protein
VLRCCVRGFAASAAVREHCVCARVLAALLYINPWLEDQWYTSRCHTARAACPWFRVGGALITPHHRFLCYHEEYWHDELTIFSHCRTSPGTGAPRPAPSAGRSRSGMRARTSREHNARAPPN